MSGTDVFLHFIASDDFAFIGERVHPAKRYEHGFNGGVWAITPDVERELREFLEDDSDVEGIDAMENTFRRDTYGRLLLTNDEWPLLGEVCEEDALIFETSLIDPDGDAGPWVGASMSDLVDRIENMNADALYERVDQSGAATFGPAEGFYAPGDLSGSLLRVRFMPAFRVEERLPQWTVDIDWNLTTRHTVSASNPDEAIVKARAVLEEEAEREISGDDSDLVSLSFVDATTTIRN